MRIDEVHVSDLGYRDVLDFSKIAQLGYTRRPKLTLRHLNRLKKVRATKKVDEIKRNQLLSIMYGLPDESGGAGL